MSKTVLPDWEDVLSAAARLQSILPDAVLVGGTASALYADHRRSHDADHVLVDLTQQFDEVLRLLESVAGWKTARIQRPVQILGNLDGIETGIRQLIREQPLETVETEYHGYKIVLPTLSEILRIKAVLILKRNATRDYLDLVALADTMDSAEITKAFMSFDEIYPQPNNESALQQLQIQLANPMPYDLESEQLSEYRQLDKRWHEWSMVKKACIHLSEILFEMASETEAPSET